MKIMRVNKNEELKHLNKYNNDNANNNDNYYEDYERLDYLDIKELTPEKYINDTIANKVSINNKKNGTNSLKKSYKDIDQVFNLDDIEIINADIEKNYIDIKPMVKTVKSQQTKIQSPKNKLKSFTTLNDYSKLNKEKVDKMLDFNTNILYINKENEADRKDFFTSDKDLIDINYLQNEVSKKLTSKISKNVSTNRKFNNLNINI